MTNIDQMLQEAIQDCHMTGKGNLADSFVECANEMRRLREGVIHSLEMALVIDHDTVYEDLKGNPELRDKLLGMLWTIELSDGEG